MICGIILKSFNETGAYFLSSQPIVYPPLPQVLKHFTSAIIKYKSQLFHDYYELSL